MYPPNYEAIKYTQQERIDRAANQRGANQALRLAKLARRAERRTRRDAAEADRRARRRSMGRLIAMVRRRGAASS